MLVATGSEVSVAVQAKKLLGDAGKGVRVVSIPCLDAFLRQDEAYRSGVLPAGVKRYSIEIGITQPWRSIVGDAGLTLGHDGFGYSAPAETIQEKLGMTPQQVADRVAAWL